MRVPQQRTTRWVAVVMVTIGAFTAPAVAQFPLAPGSSAGPQIQPPVSPYLNLTRTGANPAVNYYGIVRPQAQFATSLQALQNQAYQPSPFAAQPSPDQVPVTGHSFGFQNYRNYFQNQYTAGGLGAAGYRPPAQTIGVPTNQQLGVPQPRRR